MSQRRGYRRRVSVQEGPWLARGQADRQRPRVCKERRGASPAAEAQKSRVCQRAVARARQRGGPTSGVSVRGLSSSTSSASPSSGSLTSRPGGGCGTHTGSAAHQGSAAHKGSAPQGERHIRPTLRGPRAPRDLRASPRREAAIITPGGCMCNCMCRVRRSKGSDRSKGEATPREATVSTGRMVGTGNSDSRPAAAAAPRSRAAPATAAARRLSVRGRRAPGAPRRQSGAGGR